MIVLDQVKKVFQGSFINICLNIEEGSIFGLIGKSGSGKTTILKILSNIIPYDSGNLIFPKNKKTAIIFQDHNLLENLTVFDNVALALKISKEYSKEKVLKAIKFVGLEGKEKTYPSRLSGGQRQRVAIARAIVSKPDILLCDEPSASLDQKTSKEMLKLFLKINKEYKTTIIIATHELDLAKAICDKAAIIKQGYVFDVFDVKKNEDVLYNETNYEIYAKEVLTNG